MSRLGERPYSCDICQRAFRVASTLYAHVRTHTRTQAEHLCAVCGAVSVHIGFFGHNNSFYWDPSGILLQKLARSSS